VSYQELDTEIDEFLSILYRRAVSTRAVRAALYQGKKWTDRQGRVHAIATMDANYARNIIAFLQRQAEIMYEGETAEWQFLPEPRGEMAADHFHEGFSWLLETSPEEWLEEQPLVIALRKRLAIIRKEAGS
jgi:hypothetical protein